MRGCTGIHVPRIVMWMSHSEEHIPQFCGSHEKPILRIGRRSGIVGIWPIGSMRGEMYHELSCGRVIVEKVFPNSVGVMKSP